MNWSKINIVIFLMFAIASGSVWFTMPQKSNLYDDIDLSEIEQTLANIEYWDKAKNETTNILYQTGITKIVLHHTATNPNQHPQVLFNAIQNTHAKRWIRWWITKTWQQMMYHRLIWSDWTIRGDKDFNEIWWWTKENNVWVIHIAMQGDFNIDKPTEKQYESLKQIIDSINIRYWELAIVWHWQLEDEHTACPWKLFDYERVHPVWKQHSFNENLVQDLSIKAIAWAWIEIPSDKSYNVLFSLSRYYSPEKWQNKYFRWSYESDVTMNCWAGAIGNEWCLYPATWIRYTMANKNKSVACSPQYKKWTKIWLWIQWKEHIVTCEDRWSAIQNNRLDMYCGIWQYAVDNWNTCITWPIYWKVLQW